MALHPDLPARLGLYFTQEFKTLKSGQTPDGYFTTKKKWTQPLWTLSIPLNYIDGNLASEIVEFHRARWGSAEAFTIYDPFVFHHLNVPLGMGDNSKYLFNLKTRNADQVVVYLDGEEPASGAYTIEAGDETNDYQDIVNFNSIPAYPQRITASFRGRKYFAWAKYKEDSLQVNPQGAFTFEGFAYNINVTIIAREDEPEG